MAYESMRPEDVVFVAFREGGKYYGPLLPSSEWQMHFDLYAARWDCLAVVHAHPVYCTTVACLRRDIPAYHYMVGAAGGKAIRCAAYATFGTKVCVCVCGCVLCFAILEGLDLYERSDTICRATHDRDGTPRHLRCVCLALLLLLLLLVCVLRCFDWQELSQSVMEALSGGVKACLLANHGMISYGSSLSSALKLVRRSLVCASIHPSIQLPSITGSSIRPSVRACVRACVRPPCSCRRRCADGWWWHGWMDGTRSMRCGGGGVRLWL